MDKPQDRIQRYIVQSNHKNNNFIGHVTTLLSGAVGGQVVLLMVLPIVTRLYSPAVFGSVQSIDAIAQIVMIISALAYQRAFVVSDSEQAVSYTHLTLPTIYSV